MFLETNFVASVSEHELIHVFSGGEFVYTDKKMTELEQWFMRRDEAIEALAEDLININESKEGLRVLARKYFFEPKKLFDAVRLIGARAAAYIHFYQCKNLRKRACIMEMFRRHAELYFVAYQRYILNRTCLMNKLALDLQVITQAVGNGAALRLMVLQNTMLR